MEDTELEYSSSFERRTENFIEKEKTCNANIMFELNKYETRLANNYLLICIIAHLIIVIISILIISLKLNFIDIQNNQKRISFSLLDFTYRGSENEAIFFNYDCIKDGDNCKYEDLLHCKELPRIINFFPKIDCHDLKLLKISGISV
jgi:hypothetical protein